MKRQIAVVTGGAGFLGSHVVDKLLSKNFYVKVIDNFCGGHLKNIEHNFKNKNLELFNANILNLKKEKKIFYNCDYVFHFAGIGDIVPSIENPQKYMDVNVMGTVKILEHVKNYKIKKFVYAASSSCYGLAKVPTSETHGISPQYPYALSKYIGEQTTLHWGKVYKIPVNSIRIFNTYGPRVKTTGAYGSVIGVFFKQKLENKPLTVVGNGKQSRDFLHVYDVAEAFIKVAQKAKIGEIYNLGAGNPQTIKKLTQIIGGKIIYIKKRPGEPVCTWANIKKIKTDINWTPKISFNKGINSMMKNIKDWKDAPLWNPKNIKKTTKLWFKYLQ